MAVPKYDPEFEAKIKEGKALIAAGGCSAISFWSRTDAERLCPDEYKKEVAFEPLEGMVYRSEWVDAAKRAINLIQRGIEMLEPKKPDTPA